MKKKHKNTPLSLGVPKDFTLEKQGITQSLIASFLQCRQKFIYAINRMSSPKKINTTNFGSIIHAILSELYKVKKPEVFHILENLRLYRKENSEDIAMLEAQKIERDFAVAEVVLTQYISYYASDWEEMREREPEEEITFSPLTANPIIGRCKIDGRYRDKNGKKWLIEHKTKGRISEESLVKRLSFDPQNLFYLLADYRKTNEEAIGVLYNIIRNPQIKQKETETLQEFCNRLTKDIMERPEFYFLRFEIPYTTADTRRFYFHLREIILDISAVVKGERAIYRNCYACDSPYECEYLDACASNSFAGYYQREKIFSELDCEY